MSEIAATRKFHRIFFAMIAALTSGISGCAFMAGSVFAVTAAKPIIWLMILLAIPGFFLWGIAYPLYKNVKKRREEKVKPLIEAKLDEAEKGVREGACTAVTATYATTQPTYARNLHFPKK